MTKEQCNLLKNAQLTYGNSNQLVIAVEELAELSAVLTKYIRYNNHEDAVSKLKDSVIEEVADVSIILQHIKMIFDLKESDINIMIDKKLNRLQRWLSTTSSLEQTMKDRNLIKEDDCSSCYYWDKIDTEEAREQCTSCYKNNYRKR